MVNPPQKVKAFDRSHAFKQNYFSLRDGHYSPDDISSPNSNISLTYLLCT
jgi:hypothetical protein